VCRTSVADAQAYRLVMAPNYPGPYAPWREYYAAPFSPAPNTVTVDNLVEGDMYFVKVNAGTSDGQFESVGSPVAVAIPSKSVRTGVSNLFVAAYDETFCRLTWEIPGSGVEETGPAATHFAVAYRCGDLSVRRPNPPR